MSLPLDQRNSSRDDNQHQIIDVASYGFLLDKLNVGIVILDQDAKVVTWNAWFAKHVDIQLDDIQGRVLESIFPDLKDTRLMQAINQCLDAGLSSFLSDKLNHKKFPLYSRGMNGESLNEIAHAVNIKPMQGPQNAGGCFIEIFDVTSASIRERTMQEQAEKLKQSNADLEQFAYIASHDLQEPLRTIRGFGTLLLQDHIDDFSGDGKDYLERIVKGAERLQNMVSDLLTFSRLSKGDFALKPVDLNELMQALLVHMDAQIKEANATIEFGDLPLVCADYSQSQQLLQNLISNACKFRKPDVDPVIKIYAFDNDEVSKNCFCKKLNSICVEDNGIGFEQEHIDKIFKAFERLHTRSKYPGTGLGLSICRRIVERHNGKITAVGEPGVGSKFIFSLPLCSHCYENCR